MESQPLVSVGIPTYNRPLELKRCLDEILNQTYKNLEIIISNNCSSDNLVDEICNDYKSKDNRVIYFRQSINIEIEPNFNFVYKEANGKYFMWISDDDSFDSNYVEECVSFLEGNKEFVLCSGISRYYRKNKLLFSEKPISILSRHSLSRLYKYLGVVNKNGVFYGVYRNNISFEMPIRKHVGADWSFISQISLLGKIKVLENCNCNRSDDGGSASRTKLLNRWNVKGINKVFFEVYIASEIAKNLFVENKIKEKFNLPTRRLVQTSVLIMLTLKFFLNSISKRFKARYHARQ